MRSCFVFFFLLLAHASATAQEEYHDFGQAYSFKVGQQAWVFADTANVRVSAAAGAPVQDRLLQGMSVKIVALGNAFVLNQKSAPWCTVTYSINGVAKTGALWGGLLSPRTLQQGAVRFVYGMKFPADDTSKTWIDVKALRHDSLVARTGFYIASSESANGAHEAKMKPTKGLNGLETLLYFYYSGEACAIPTYEQYIGWSGKQFVVFPQLNSSADAGAYVDVCTFVFPADKGGLPGFLLHKERSEEYDEHDKPIHKTVKTTRYKWNGGKLAFQKQ